MVKKATQRMGYAGFWPRWGALIIDGIIIKLALLLPEHLLSGVASGVVAIIFVTAYYCGLEASSFQATFGKQLMNIWVGTINRKRITLIQSVSRFFMWLVVDLLLIACLMLFLQLEGFTAFYEKSRLFAVYFLVAMVALNLLLYVLPVVFTRQKTGLHDWSTKTRVYYGPIPTDVVKEEKEYAVTTP